MYQDFYGTSDLFAFHGAVAVGVHVMIQVKGEWRPKEIFQHTATRAVRFGEEV